MKASLNYSWSVGLRTWNHLGLEMRLACLSDSPQILVWRNSVEARRFSRDGHYLSLEEHNEWFNRKLAESAASSILYFSSESVPVGMARLDRKSDDSFEISIIVDPLMQKKGYGRKMLSMTLSFANTELRAKRIQATISNLNVASIHLFLSNGFTFIENKGNFANYEFKCC